MENSIIRGFVGALATAALCLSPAHAVARPPSVPPASAPQLAVLGPEAVSVSQVRWTEGERTLSVLIWRPARAADGAATTYDGVVPAGPERAPIPYQTPGLAVRDAPAKPGPFPAVIVSHGFGGSAEAMSWLGENLATKGYVVIAPDHADRPYEAPGALAEAIGRRAPDIAMIARRALSDPALNGAIDPQRLAVAGYSMGGLGALRAAGAPFSPVSPLTTFVPRGALDPLIEGGALDNGPLLAGLRAMALIAPWGGQSNIGAFSSAALARITTPTLILAGDRDDISGYEDGVATIYRRLDAAPRTLVTFENAGHTIGANPLPQEGAGVFQIEEFFEDPVWRKDRVHAVSLHFLTAFLDLHLKDNQSRAAFLALPNGRAADTMWPQPPGAPSTGVYASGQPGVTHWPGFQRRWAEGLRIESSAP